MSDITNMQQLRAAHRKQEFKNLSLKAFAKSMGLEGIIQRAHAAANKSRSPETKERTRAATRSRKENASKKGAKTTTKAA